jgi:hypothetical protein
MSTCRQHTVIALSPSRAVEKRARRSSKAANVQEWAGFVKHDDVQDTLEWLETRGWAAF